MVYSIRSATTILLYYVCDVDEQSVNYDSKCIQIFDKYINLNIWDTAGQEKYFFLTRNYFREAKGVIFVYDVTCENTLFNIGKWFDIVKQEVPDDVTKILVGNKCDLNPKQISALEGKAVADIYGLYFFEVSSKENINVSPMFHYMATKIVNSHWNTFFPAPLVANNYNMVDYDYELCNDKREDRNV